MGIVTNRATWLYRSAMPGRLDIRVLGPVQVAVDGAPLVVDTRKAVALLAYVAVTARPASRETLAALLWPDSADGEARGALRRTLSVLNSALGGHGLTIDRHTVTIVPGETEVDLQGFRRALARARAHSHPPNEPCPACLAALDEAVAFDRGEFMAGFALRDSESFDDWQRSEAESHRRDLTGALERLARTRAASADWAASLAAGRRWIALDPLHEPAHRLLMEVHAQAGEVAAAIGQYRECVRLLDAELGVAPLSETTDLYEAIRAGRIPDGRRPGTPLPRAGTHEPDDERAATAAPTTRLIGRDTELAAMLEAYRAIGPDGRLFVIEGEPGIGKTRFAAEFTARVRAAGGGVLEAPGHVGEAAIAFGTTASLIRSGLDRPGAVDRLASVSAEARAEVARLVPLPGASASGAAAGVGDAFGRARLLEAIAEVLTALAGGPAPGVLLIDDVQWIDASSLEVVAYLARRLAGRPLAILTTWRREDLDDGRDIQVAFAAERAGLMVRTTLGRLGRAGVAALAASALGAAATDDLIDALLAESEGVPLYLVEALLAGGPTAASGPGPVAAGGVAALLRSRIGSVGEIAGQLLAAAAVIGRSFDLGTVRAASGRSEDETIAGLEELVRRGLVREMDANVVRDLAYDFSHGRLRDVAYESLGLARRRSLHRRVAESLGSTAGGPRDEGVRWALIAHHEALAGRTGEAAEAHRRAGEHARSVFANAEARDHFSSALGLGHPATGDLHAALGEVLTLLGDYVGAIAHFESAAASASPDHQAAIEHRLGLVHARRGDWERADSHLVAALTAAPEADRHARSAILADRSAIAHRLGHAAAATLAATALDIAEAAGDQAGIARARNILGIIGRAGHRLPEAAVHLERALVAADESGDPGLQIAARNTLALVRADTGDLAGAISLIDEALALCERQGDRHRQAALENNLADLLEGLGRREESRRHQVRAVAIFADVGGRPGELEPEIWKLVEW